MPSTSKKQARFMAAAAHNPEFAKKVGISMDVAKEFNAADKGKKFSSGTRVDLQKVAKQKTDHGKEALFKKGGKTMAKKEMHSEKGEMKQDIAQDKKLIKKAFGMHDKQLHEKKKTNLSKLKGGGMAKETMGPRTMSKDVEKGSNKLTKFGESAVQKRGKTKGKNLGDSGPVRGIMGGMKKGGKVKRYEEGGFATEEGQNANIDDDVRARAMKAIAEGGQKDEAPAAAKARPSFKAKAKDAGFTSAETKGGAALMYRKDRKMAKGGSASSRGDGIASKGKTRGKMC